MSNLPKIQDLYSDKLVAQKNDAFVTLMNQTPNPNWIKKHPFISGYKYLPIERVEFLLKSIFKAYRIEITGQGTAFNGVWVTVRVHYLHPITGEWQYHDGIGASQLQTAKGTSPADLGNINNGALSMAFPMAKTIAIKDACDHFGNLFGADLNRKDVIAYNLDATLIPLDRNHPNWDKVVEALKSKSYTVDDIKSKYEVSPEIEEELCKLSN
jgi:hypothetical protein